MWAHPGIALSAGTALQNIIKQIKFALEVYTLCVTSNDHGQDTPFPAHSVPAQPPLGIRHEHPDPEFL